MARIQEEMLKKYRYLRPFELYGCSVRAVDQSQNWFGQESGQLLDFVWDL